MSKKVGDLQEINFWGAVKTLYPKGHAMFNDWIDEYKKDNDWDRLFNGGIGYLHQWENKDSRGGETITTKAPKYHDLPMAMQVGIFYQFLAENANEGPDYVTAMKELFLEFFKMIEPEL